MYSARQSEGGKGIRLGPLVLVGGQLVFHTVVVVVSPESVETR